VIVEQLLKVRYLALVVVILAILHAMAFLFMGAEIAFRTYLHMFAPETGERTVRHGMELLHSLDFLLVSLVLIILAVGVAKLFLAPATATHDRFASYPTLLKVESFSDLKILLWESILTALLILGLSSLTEELTGKMEWTALVVPVAIFLLALSLYFMKKP
jgi:uncharacterized membrane protein YqhA